MKARPLHGGCDVYRITSKSYKCNVKKIWKPEVYASGFFYQFAVEKDEMQQSLFVQVVDDTDILARIFY